MYGFYLNYVGCKVREELKASGHKPSFTLTMWDVKILKRTGELGIINVLP